MILSYPMFYSDLMKDFWRWHDKKEKLDQLENRPHFYPREIWYCHTGLNVGFEQDGKTRKFWRPVLIIKKFSRNTFWGLPLTSKNRQNKYYHIINFHYFNENRVSSVILSQLRLFDAKRLNHKLSTLSKEQFYLIIRKLKALLP